MLLYVSDLTSCAPHLRGTRNKQEPCVQREWKDWSHSSGNTHVYWCCWCLLCLILESSQWRKWKSNAIYIHFQIGASSKWNSKQHKNCDVKFLSLSFVSLHHLTFSCPSTLFSPLVFYSLFVFRSIYDDQPNAHRRFMEKLDARIRNHDREIEKMCNFHHQGFVDAIKELLKVRADAEKLMVMW